MLTSKQLQALEPLTTHAKYGKLLSDAIEVWKREDVIPVVKNYGIDYELISKASEKFDAEYVYSPNKYYVNNKIRNCMCLIGACLVNKKANGYEISAARHYNLTNNEISNMINGFDKVEIEDDDDQNLKAYKFGMEVNKAMWPYGNEETVLKLTK